MNELQVGDSILPGYQPGQQIPPGIHQDTVNVRQAQLAAAYWKERERQPAAAAPEPISPGMAPAPPRAVNGRHLGSGSGEAPVSLACPDPPSKEES